MPRSVKSNGKSQKLQLPSSKEIVDSFLPNRSLTLRQSPKWLKLTALSIATLGVSALVTSFLYRIDEVVSLRGKLESSRGNVDISTPVGGKITEIFVEDGEFVSQGNEIIEFDSKDSVSTLQRLLEELRIEKINYEKTKQIIKTQLGVLNQRIQTKESLVSELKQLTEMGGFQKSQYLQTLDDLHELKSNENIKSITLQTLELDFSKSNNRIKDQIFQTRLGLEYKNVTAPISGVIFELKAQKNGVLKAGEVIAQIIPQDGLKVKVLVPNSEVSSIKVGQQAAVRVDAYPYTRYGELSGKITSIGADVIPPSDDNLNYSYPVIIELTKNYLTAHNRKYKIRTGMSVVANVKLRDKPIISIITDIFSNETDSLTQLRRK